MSNKPYLASLLQRERGLPNVLSALEILENVGNRRENMVKMPTLRSLLSGSGDALIEKARELGIRPCDLLYYWAGRSDSSIVSGMCRMFDWNHFKAWRIMRNMTREEAADLLGIKPQTMISYERSALNGLRAHKHFASTIKNFAKVYDCPEEEFIPYLFNSESKHTRLSAEERSLLNLDNDDPLIEKVKRIAHYRNVLMPRAFRLYYGWTVAELSRMTGINNVSSIYSLEKNTIKISADKKAMLAKAFQCREEDLDNRFLCKTGKCPPLNQAPLNLKEKRELVAYFGSKVSAAERMSVSGLRVFRKMRGDTLEKVGQVCGCSKQNISQMEANILLGREVQNLTVQTLMEYYGCEYSDLAAVHNA